LPEIEADPKARLYVRKKAFLLGLQAKSRYGSDGWVCTDGQPRAGDRPVGGVYLQGTLHQDDQRPLARCRTQSVPPARSGQQEFSRRNTDQHPERNAPLGVDLELVRDVPDLHAIAERHFAPNEMKEFLRLAPERRREAFYVTWTRKEALVKGLGLGVSFPLDSFCTGRQNRLPD
jgi:hypothetical protein